MSTPNYAALSASDGSGEPVRATVQADRSIGSETIVVDNTTNWPTGTFIATTGTLLSSGKLDPTTVQVFYGTASGTDITITAFAAGYSDLGNSINDVVVIKPTTEWANIVSQGIQSTTQFPANFANFVEATGGVWTAGVGLVGSATSGFVWYQGTRSAMAAVVGHTFTASKDTYIDYNPSTSSWTYVPETNGAAEPAVTANSVRVAKVVTGSSTISSVSQQPYSHPVPLVWKFAGLAEITSSITTSSTTEVQATGLSVPVTIPAGYTQVRITVGGGGLGVNTASKNIYWTIWRGTVGSGTQVNATQFTQANANYTVPTTLVAMDQPGAGSVVYNVGWNTDNPATATFIAGATAPVFILVEYC